jgi:hypothetical protein
MILDQTYTPGMTCAEINFFTQYMGQSVIKMAKLNDPTASPEELARRFAGIRDTSYISMKQASILMPNGRVAQVSTQAGAGSYHGDVYAGTYEVIDRTGRVSDDRRMEYEMTCEQVTRVLADIAADRPGDGKSNPRMAAIEMPKFLYQRELHGRLLYDDYANFDPALSANRVVIGSSRWVNLRSTHGLAEEPIREINAWCEEHCMEDFAWTACGPIWAFRDHRDAFNFRITWG